MVATKRPKKISQKRFAEAGAKLAERYLGDIHSPDAINGVKDRHLPPAAREAAFSMFRLANDPSGHYTYSDKEAFNIGIDLYANERRVALYNKYGKRAPLLTIPGKKTLAEKARELKGA